MQPSSPTDDGEVYDKEGKKGGGDNDDKQREFVGGQNKARGRRIMTEMHDSF